MQLYMYFAISFISNMQDMAYFDKILLLPRQTRHAAFIDQVNSQWLVHTSLLHNMVWFNMYIVHHLLEINMRSLNSYTYYMFQ